MDKEEVKIRRKVQLRKKAEDDVVSTPAVETSTTSSSPSSDSSSKKWIWAIPVILVVLGIIFFMGRGNDKEASDSALAQADTETTIAETPIEENVETVQPENTDEETVTEEPSVVEEVAPENVPVEAPSKVVSTTPSSSKTNVSGDVEMEAMKVIRGDYGDGQERKERLGSSYQTIQNRVNELKREGAF